MHYNKEYPAGGQFRGWFVCQNDKAHVLDVSVMFGHLLYSGPVILHTQKEKKSVEGGHYLEEEGHEREC